MQAEIGTLPVREEFPLISDLCLRGYALMMSGRACPSDGDSFLKIAPGFSPGFRSTDRSRRGFSPDKVVFRFCGLKPALMLFGSFPPP